MKQNDFVPCDNRITYYPVFRTNPNHLPCASCGSTELKLGAGKEPHTASLLCGKCERRDAASQRDRFIKWIGKSDLAKIENQGAQF